MSLLGLPSDIVKIISGLIKDSIYDLRLTCRALSKQRVLSHREYVVRSGTQAIVLATKANISLQCKSSMMLDYTDMRHVEHLTLHKMMELEREKFPSLRTLSVIGGILDIYTIPDWVESVTLSGKFGGISGDIPHNIHVMQIENSIWFDPKSNNLKELRLRKEPKFCKVPSGVNTLGLTYAPTTPGRVLVEHKIRLKITKLPTDYFEPEVLSKITTTVYRTVRNSWIILSDQMTIIMTQESELDLSTLNLPDIDTLKIVRASRIENYRIVSAYGSNKNETTIVSNIPSVKNLILARCLATDVPVVHKLEVVSAKGLSQVNLANITNLKVMCVDEENILDCVKLHHLKKLEITTSHIGGHSIRNMKMFVTLPVNLRKLSIYVSSIYHLAMCNISKKVFTGERLAKLFGNPGVYSITNTGFWFKVEHVDKSMKLNEP